MFKVSDHLFLTIESDGVPTAQHLGSWDAGDKIPAHVIGAVVWERQQALDRAAEMTRWLAKAQVPAA